MTNFYLSIPLFTFYFIASSSYQGYDNETYTTIRGMIEGMMGMAGTSNTWKLMVCSLPSCCFVVQRRHERLQGPFIRALKNLGRRIVLNVVTLRNIL